MKTIALVIITLIFFASCKCPPPLPDGTKPACVYIGPSITVSLGYKSSILLGATIWGDPAYPPVNIPINKHDPEPIYPEPVTVTPTK